MAPALLLISGSLGLRFQTMYESGVRTCEYWQRNQERSYNDDGKHSNVQQRDRVLSTVGYSSTVRLAGKTAIITGAARGIGLATAIRFAEEGARVALGDVDERTAVASLQRVQEHSPDSFFRPLDVTHRESVQAFVDETRRRFGRIDILINNAGITADAQLLKMTEADFDRVIDINLKGVFNCTQATAAVMVEQGYGKIVSATSVVGLYGNFGQTNYVAAKAGVIGMTKVWARELGRKGILVNAIAPGFINTDMSRKVPDKFLNIIKEKTPLARMGTTSDIANAYLFLASDESSFVNGAVLSVDGGLVV